MIQVSISIQPVLGGFIVEYPTQTDNGVVVATEVATSVGKAMRLAKDAVQEFSLVKKAAEDAE